ncbi:hypothetical protein [Miniphocaeibacter massiliensis]|uniref:hypothetical protein n=1 Tax=Miniphocaeibacter massiliensis TaxID=2041841 RepID=UPI000C1C1EA7|nr:hypothetical protein [Miniphocaeibacter massiliensis]
MKNKKTVLKILLITIVLILATVLVIFRKDIYKYWKENRKITENWSEKIKIEDFVEVGTGKGVYKEDTFFVVNSENIDYVTLGLINVVPEKYFIYANFKADYIYKEKLRPHQILDFKEAEILVHDIETKELVKTIDLLKWIKKYPDYEFDILNYFTFKGKGGDYYLNTNFIKKLELKPGEEVSSISRDKFQVYYNLSTYEETEIKEVEERWNILDKKVEEENREYSSLIYDAEEVWDKFDKETKLLDSNPAKDKNIDELRKEKLPDFFYYVEEGKLEIKLSTPALPKENKELYTRFPELKKYRDQEWRMVKIVFASKPTPEEVVAMFTDESK